MSFHVFEGTGRLRRPEPTPDNPNPRPWDLPPLPEWRRHSSPESLPNFVMPPGLAEAVNTALNLRRPLLLTGSAGSGKSTMVELLAAELGIGPVLRWHITSQSVLDDGLYQYDALDRLHSAQNGDPEIPLEKFVKLGPLGTALADLEKPRAVLIDEIDKSDLDLPGDMLNVLEAGEFEIPPLLRAKGSGSEPGYRVRGADKREYDVGNGEVVTRHYPIIVFTSNEERTFAPPFLRRCVRFKIEPPSEDLLAKIVERHIGTAGESQRTEIRRFAERLRGGHELAVNQLVELVHLVTQHRLTDEEAAKVRTTLLQGLTEQ